MLLDSQPIGADPSPVVVPLVSNHSAVSRMIGVTALLNSDVLFAESVTVTVMNDPGVDRAFTVALKAALPLLSSVNVELPRNV